MAFEKAKAGFMRGFKHQPSKEAEPHMSEGGEVCMSCGGPVGDDMKYAGGGEVEEEDTLDWPSPTDADEESDTKAKHSLFAKALRGAKS